jgi:hypothetical protein
MRTAKRVLVACVFGVPLALSVSGVAANAAPSKGPKPSIKQEEENTTDQANTNKQPIYQLNVGDKGHQNASAVADLDNKNKNEQGQEADGD